MRLPKRLIWTTSPLGELEAQQGSYRYVIWQDKGSAELRVIRYDYVSAGVGVPFYDFSIRCASLNKALKLADRLNREFYKARHYNPNAF